MIQFKTFFNRGKIFDFFQIYNYSYLQFLFQISILYIRICNVYYVVYNNSYFYWIYKVRSSTILLQFNILDHVFIQFFLLYKVGTFSFFCILLVLHTRIPRVCVFHHFFRFIRVFTQNVASYSKCRRLLSKLTLLTCSIIIIYIYNTVKWYQPEKKNEKKNIIL